MGKLRASYADETDDYIGVADNEFYVVYLVNLESLQGEKKYFCIHNSVTYLFFNHNIVMLFFKEVFFFFDFIV